MKELINEKKKNVFVNNEYIRLTDGNYAHWSVAGGEVYSILNSETIFGPSKRKSRIRHRKSSLWP